MSGVFGIVFEIHIYCNIWNVKNNFSKTEAKTRNPNGPVTFLLFSPVAELLFFSNYVMSLQIFLQSNLCNLKILLL